MALPAKALKVGQEDYWLDQIARDREEYFSGRGESPGRYVGSAAAASGLAGVATAEQVRAMFQGQDPATGEQRCQPLLRADPRSKLPAGPLLATLREHASAQGVTDLAELARSKALAGDVRAVEAACRAGGARRVKVETAERVCRMLLRADPHTVYGEAFDAAWRHRGKRIDARVAAFDLCFSSPKSVSLLAAGGGPARRAEVTAVRTTAGIPAAEAGLLEVDVRVRFWHPLVRSSAYRSASLPERQQAHRALAEATDPVLDPDRRAWHRAHATPGPDEDVAAELERSASRAQARGGLAAAAAFLERAAILTPDPDRRARRGLAAARAKRDAGALEAALELLVAVEAGPLDALSAAEVEHLRGQIALVQRRGSDAGRLLLSAARRLEPLDAALARETHLEALGTAAWAGDLDGSGVLRAAAEAARAAPPGPDPPRAVDVLLEGLALRLTDGYAAAAPTMTQALRLVLALDVANDEVGRWLWLAGGRATVWLVALELWDADSWHALVAAQARFARDTGALVQLQYALNSLAAAHLFAGELTTATRLLDEERLIGQATGNPPIGYTEMTLAAWRGREPAASKLIEATLGEATERGLSRMLNAATSASSVLHNGLGRHDTARDAAWRAFERDQLGFGPFVVSELAEAASRIGDEARVRAALEWLSERTEATRVTPSAWALGIQARVRALLSEGDAAENLYRESIAHLGRTRVRVQLARAHLLYGEWLRRQRRRLDARGQLRTAHDLLEAMGVEAFAERARRELLATGETARKRTVQTSGELTAQEAVIARLAREGLSNPEIGTRLFISARTVQYHLGKVFAKLDISSRAQLDQVLPSDPATTRPI